jgi:hypothetical protein
MPSTRCPRAPQPSGRTGTWRLRASTRRRSRTLDCIRDAAAPILDLPFCSFIARKLPAKAARSEHRPKILSSRSASFEASCHATCNAHAWSTEQCATPRTPTGRLPQTPREAGRRSATRACPRGPLALRTTSSQAGAQRAECVAVLQRLAAQRHAHQARQHPWQTPLTLLSPWP